MTDIPIKIQFVKTLSNLKPSRIIAVKADSDIGFKLYITDKNATAFPLKDGIGETLNIINTDGNLNITGTNTITINVAPELITLINQATKKHKVVEVTLSEIGITTTDYTKEEIETAVTAYRQTLPFDAVYDILVVEEVVTDLFDVTADWVGNGVINQATFISFLQGGNSDLFNIVIDNFILTNNRLTCNLFAQGGYLDFINIGITEVLGIGNLSDLILFDLNGNQIVKFNPTVALPSSLQALDLRNNQMTLAGYTASETWANLQTPFTNSCDVLFENNIDSVTGTNLEAILLTKNCTVNG